MKVSFSFSSLDEIEKFAHELIDAHPIALTLSVGATETGIPEPQRPPYAKCMDELTAHDLALYAAGELQVYYALANSRTLNMEQIAGIMDMDLEELAMMRGTWANGDIIEQRDAVVDMMLRDARKNCEGRIDE